MTAAYWQRKLGKRVSENLPQIITGCKAGHRKSQEALYRQYYAYSMSIGLRYGKSRAEAEEIVQDAFIKLFKNITRYDEAQAFKSWFRRILVNAAIDYYRRNEKHQHHQDIEAAYEVGHDEGALEQLSSQDIMAAVQQLPPAYRLVFNLYAVEGYKHHEIAEQLNISEGTSKSNLAKARNKLQGALSHMYDKR